jgi:O-antigen/teichoic acid export membrane protein
MLTRLRRSGGVAGLSWGLIDQGFSSATNLGLSVLAGRVAGPAGLGVVFLGFSVYLMVLTMQRALVTDPLVVASTRLSADERRTAACRALTLVISAAVAASALLLVFGLLIPSPVGLGLVVFVPWLAGALVQDFWRSVLFRDGRGASAALNDGLWAAVMVLTIPLVFVAHSPWLVVLTWGAGALAGGVLGFLQTALTPAGWRPSMTWWVGRAWPLARWLGFDSLLVIVQNQFLTFAIVLILGAAPVGGLRSVQAVFAPMTLLAQAIAFPGLPMLTRLSAISTHLGRRWAARLSALAVGIVVVYLGAVALLPHHLLGVIFGREFDRFDDLIPAVAVLQLLLAGSLGFFLLLKAQGRGRVLVISRGISASFTVVLTITLALASGLTAAVWGMTIAWATGAASLTACALWLNRGPDRSLPTGSAADAPPASGQPAGTPSRTS